MGLRLITIDVTNGVSQFPAVTPGDRIGSLTVLQVPSGGTVSLAFGGMIPMPLQQGHVFANLTESDGTGGVFVSMAATPGQVLLVAGIPE